MTTSANIQKVYQDLIEEVHRHDHLYHVLDRPEISDFEYDQLLKKLMDLEEKYSDLRSQASPTMRVGGQPIDRFEKRAHRHPMLSLSNTYNPEELTEFFERVLRFLETETLPEYFCEPKLDGLAIELIYENGVLTSALTRGDGTTGENVISNVRTIRSIPLHLKATPPPALVEIRGEIVMYKEDFKSLNEQQQENGQEPFANPRNAAAGTIRQLDPQIARSRNLHFFGYSLGDSLGLKVESQSELHHWLHSVGIPTVSCFAPGPHKDLKFFKILDKGKHINLTLKSNDPSQILAYYKDIGSDRKELPFDLDGIVIKVNSFELQKQLGFVARSPRWATATKYAPEQGQTEVLEIAIQVGRTGALTPVAIMKPVSVGGVTITNATLHNQEELSRKDVRAGDTVIIQRAGDVIPEIVSVVLEKRPKGSLPFVMPTHCPICKTKAQHIEGEVIVRCPNSQCPARLKECFKHFVSRRAMNVERLGDKIIDALVDAGFVERLSHIFCLTKEQLLSLERQGEKSAQNIMDSLEKARHTTLARFIYGLGFRFVGEQNAKNLARHFQTLEAFLKSDEQSLLSVEGIGDRVASSLFSELQNARLLEDIKSLTNQGGIQFEKLSAQSSTFAGKTFVITGTLPQPREQIIESIEQLGGKVSSSVSKKTHYVVAGEEAGSKLEKAKELKVTVLNWDDFQALCQKK